MTLLAIIATGCCAFVVGLGLGYLGALHAVHCYRSKAKRDNGAD